MKKPERVPNKISDETRDELLLHIAGGISIILLTQGFLTNDIELAAKLRMISGDIQGLIGKGRAEIG